MSDPTYPEILARLEAVRTAADLQAYAEWLYASDALDESETTRTVGSRGALAPWSAPSSAEWVEDDGDDITVRLASGEYARWSNANRAWSETDGPDEDEEGLDDTDLVLCVSPDGWSLHAPGSTDEDIATGDAPPILSGPGEPTDADYRAARRRLGWSAAETWLALHGFDPSDGSRMANAAGERVGELLSAERLPSGLWVGDDIESATRFAAHHFDDGSSIILTEGWWDIAQGGLTEALAVAITDETMDFVAAELGLERGAMFGTHADRADRIYPQGDARTGSGYASIADALDAR